MEDPVDHPTHYLGHPSGIEVISYTRLLPFGPGNAVKYVMRRDLKADPLEDLSKASWYINDSLDNGVVYKKTAKMIDIVTRVVDAEPDPVVQLFLQALYLPLGYGFFSKWAPDYELARETVASLMGWYHNVDRH